jgi:hypothetical protein
VKLKTLCSLSIVIAICMLTFPSGSSSCAWAQTITGSVTGVVTDSTGAVVPGATVSATNVDTGVTVSGPTNGSGIYNIRFLQIGRYTLKTKATGFTAQSYGPFALEIDQVAKVDVALKVGADSTTVQVNVEAQPILNTENATLGETFTENTINNIPLNGRDFSELTVYTPGAVSTNFGAFGSQQSTERDTNGSTIANVNGNRAQSNDYVLDGQEINENLNNTVGYTPSPDSIGQIQVISSNANAEFGNVNGGEIVMVTKSGTNHIHGSAFGFLENYQLDANSWTNKDSIDITPRNPFTQTIFGGTIGGPIFKDKLFFFLDYEGYREHTGGLATYSVAPAAFRGLTATANCPVGDADLSSLKTVSGIQLYNTQNPGGPVPYTNNCVPITNPVALYLFAHPNIYPLPNNPTGDPLGIQKNFSGPSGQFQRNDQGDVKIDWHFRNRDVISGRYSQGLAEDGQTHEPIPVEFPTASNYPDHLFSTDWTHTFSSAIVNSLRASYARIRYNSGVTTDPSGVFGLQGNSVVGIPSQAQQTAGFSQQNFSNAGTTSSGVGQISSVGANPTPEIFIDNVFQYGDDLTWQKGKHLLKFGAELTRYQQNSFYPGNDGELGSFSYTGQFSAPPPSDGNSPATYGFADFLDNHAYEASVGQVVGRTGQRQYRNAYFVQDDWKVKSNLTVNLGLRWQYDQPLYEVNNKEANINLKTAVVEYAGHIPSANTFANATVCPTRACYNGTYSDFQPRVGFSYQPIRRLVVRGGYGITTYLEGTGANLRLTQNPPYHNDFDTIASVPISTDGGYSEGSPVLTSNGFPLNVPPVTTFYAWKANLQSAIIQEFSLTTEYQVTNTSSLQIGYVGEIGKHLVDPAYANQLTAPNTPAPYVNIVGQGGVVKVTASDSSLSYNALQAVFRQRLTAGLELTANYTYSKALTDDIGYYGASNIQQQYYQQNVYDIHGDYGPAGDDVRHAFSATGTYNLPYGHGQRFGQGANFFLEELLGGWKFSASSIAYTGFPVTVSSPAEYSNEVFAYTGAARPDQIAPVHIAGRSLTHWFGTTAQSSYTTQPTTGFGNVKTGSLRAPGFFNVDTAFQKNFKTWHDENLDFRADLFNAFNIASYGNPDNGITDANFGQISSTRSLERHIQFELKYQF